jgi:hypothetical protein
MSQIVFVVPVSWRNNMMIALVGYFVVTKTLEWMSRSYWWPQPCRKLVKEFVRICDTCARTKVVHHCPYNLLKPLPNLVRSWAFISLDFIINLLETSGFNWVLLLVDRFVNITHFISCYKITILKLEMTYLLLTNIVRFRGLPNVIISNRDPQFMSNFWKRPL